MNIALLLVGIYLIFLAFIINTAKKAVNILLFKMIPIMSGLFVIIYSIFKMGIVSINM